MAMIDTSPDGLARIVGRLTREYGETAAANFALDTQLDLELQRSAALIEQLAARDEMLEGLRLQVFNMGAELDKLRLAADPDPKNAHRYSRAKRKARASGGS